VKQSGETPLASIKSARNMYKQIIVVAV
jgi:hypothetical protein